MGGNFNEETEEHGRSIFNPQKAELACRKSEEYMKYGIGSHQITVLSTYLEQVRLLRDTISHDKFEVASIGEMQESDSI